MAAGPTKFVVAFIRAFEFIFAVILVGVFSWFVHEFDKFGAPHSPREVVVTEVFACITLALTIFSTPFSIFGGRIVQWGLAFLDFAVWVGFLASAGLYKHNFHVHGYKNPLGQEIQRLREANGKDRDHHLIDALVKLGAASIIIEICLTFFTMLLSAWVAVRTEEKAETQMSEKRHFWQRGSRDRIVSSETPRAEV